MSDSLAERCAAAVAAVPHREYCAWHEGHAWPAEGSGLAIRQACSCDRDVRIGRGMRAALVLTAQRMRDASALKLSEEYLREGRTETDLLAAFTEAAK